MDRLLALNAASVLACRCPSAWLRSAVQSACRSLLSSSSALVSPWLLHHGYSRGRRRERPEHALPTPQAHPPARRGTAARLTAAPASGQSRSRVRLPAAHPPSNWHQRPGGGVETRPPPQQPRIRVSTLPQSVAWAAPHDDPAFPRIRLPARMLPGAVLVAGTLARPCFPV